MKDFEQFLHESAEHAEAAATAVTKEASTELPEGRVSTHAMICVACDVYISAIRSLIGLL